MIHCLYHGSYADFDAASWLNYAKHLFKKVDDAKALKGKSQDTIIACRQLGVPRTFRKIFALMDAEDWESAHQLHAAFCARYMVKDKESRGFKKRKSRCAEDTESELEQEEPKAKKRHVHTSQNMGAEPAIVGDPPRGFFYDNTVGNFDLTGGGYYNAPTDASGLWHGQEQDVSPAENTYIWAEQGAEDLVPSSQAVAVYHPCSHYASIGAGGSPSTIEERQSKQGHRTLACG